MAKRIVIIGSAHPLRGGLAAYNERLAHEFISQNDEVIIYTFKLQYPEFLFPGKTQFATWEAPSDLNIHVKINSINPINWILIGLQIKKLKPDLVIFKYWLPFMAPCFGTIARIIKWNKFSKIITIVDNIIPHEKHPGDRFLTNYYVKATDAFVAMSKSVYNEIDLFTKAKPKLLSPHPLFDNFGKSISRIEALTNLELDTNFKYILFFGIIREYKGLDLILKAFADERLSSQNIKLLVAGEFYVDAKIYTDLIDSLNLNDKVILKGDFIPDEDVKNYFCAADIIAQPYKHATQSGVTQIGYHFNKPMLVTNVGGLAEIIPHGKVGYVVNPDALEIADALVDFYAFQREEAFTANTIIEKEKYAWSKMTAAIDELYNQLIQKKC